MPNPLAGIHNYAAPNWGPLLRAIGLLGRIDLTVSGHVISNVPAPIPCEDCKSPSVMCAYGEGGGAPFFYYCAKCAAARQYIKLNPDPGTFMWMCEQPAGTHQYKHCDTRNYAMLRADSTLAECKAELANALSHQRTWGENLDRRLRHA